MISTNDLQEQMNQCYGTEGYYIFELIPSFTYTDGVHTFCTSAEAYWFLTDTMCYIVKLLKKHKLNYQESFFAIKLVVSEQGPADLIITDGDGGELLKHHYKSVSVPAGEWLFFFEYGTLLWHMEH